MATSTRKEIDAHVIARAIAVHIDGFEYQAPEEDRHYSHYAYIVGPDGMKIYFHADSYKGRLTIGGEYPRDERNNIYPYSAEKRADSISVSADRDAKAIAREIERRLMPAYVESYKVGAKLLAEHNEHETGKRQLCTQLRAIAGDNSKVDDSMSVHYYKQDKGYFRANVDGPDSVRIDVHSATAEKAARIMRIVMEP